MVRSYEDVVVNKKGIQVVIVQSSRLVYVSFSSKRFGLGEE